MTKNEFIEAIRSPLKKEGFRKVGQYWYKRNNDIIYCINVQGSQWDRNDYYFEIGVAEHKENCTTPTLLHWLSCHRCEGNSGERNVLPSEALKCVSNTFRDINCLAELENSYKIIMQRKSQISIGFEPLKPISTRRQS